MFKVGARQDQIATFGYCHGGRLPTQMRTFPGAALGQKRRLGADTDLAEAKRQSDRLIDQVADGVLSGTAIKDRLPHLRPSARCWRRNWRLRKPSPVSLHPRIAEHYRRVVSDSLHSAARIERFVPTEAEIVVEIFRKYAAGASPRTIAANLDARGVRSPRGGT